MLGGDSIARVAKLEPRHPDQRASLEQHLAIVLAH